MTLEVGHRAFGIEDLRVLGVRVESATPPDPDDKDDTSLVVWSASYYEPDSSLGSKRVVICNLHAHAIDGWGTITVGGLFTEDGELPKGKKKLAAAIASSAALETLYDLARITFKAVAGAADVHFELPHRSPHAEVRRGEDEVVVSEQAIAVPSGPEALTESGHAGE